MRILLSILINREEKYFSHMVWIGFFTFIFFSNVLLKFVIPGYIPMSLFISAVVVTAWLCGTTSALITVLLGAIVEILFFIPGKMNGLNKIEIIRLSIFLVEGTVISLIFGKFHQMVEKIKQNEAELEELLEKEKESREAKNIFLANISHELNTPLTAISGYSELMATKNLSDEKIQQYSKIILKKSKNLNEIFNDILDLSKIEAGHLKIHRQDVNLQALLADIYDTQEIFASRKNINLKLEQLGELPIYIHTDPLRLKQILFNVIGNSIKFTHQGYVKIIVQIQNDNLIFKINDSGIGIEKEYWGTLFQNFGQGNPRVPRMHGGTGLGLSLSRKFARLLGGDIALTKSIPDVGSEFLVVIPFLKISESNYSTTFSSQS